MSGGGGAPAAPGGAIAGDWPTSDGTCVRDYLHVMDLAEGHGRALDILQTVPPHLLTLNLGSGHGHSVLELVRTFETTNGLTLPYAVVERRPGDSAVSVADPSQAEHRMGWRTRRSLADICRDGWAWQSANPHSYRSTEPQPNPELIGAQHGS